MVRHSLIVDYKRVAKFLLHVIHFTELDRPFLEMTVLSSKLRYLCQIDIPRL